MYIWCAIDLDRQLLKLRDRVEAVSAELGAKNHALTLPLHISLKISCEVEDCRFDEAVEEISAGFSDGSPFEVTPICVERCGGVVWIRHRDSDELSEMHEWLVELFKNQYGVLPHRFDSEFAYHTSLFVGEEKDAIAVYEMLKSVKLPESLIADMFVIGCSESGKAGEYRVIKNSKFAIRNDECKMKNAVSR